MTFFGQYLEKSGLRISRAEAEQRMFAKLNNPGFLADMRPLLAAAQAEGLNTGNSEARVFKAIFRVCSAASGEPWARSEEMKERFQVLL